MKRERQVMHYSAISDDAEVFNSGEDFWTAPLEGGDAVRLTIHDAEASAVPRGQACDGLKLRPHPL
jgi:hypothetical protein